MLVCQTERSNHNSRTKTVIPDSWEDISDDEEPPDLEPNLYPTNSGSQDEAILVGGPSDAEKVSLVFTDNAETVADYVGALEPRNIVGLSPEDFTNTESMVIFLPLSPSLMKA